MSLALSNAFLVNHESMFVSRCTQIDLSQVRLVLFYMRAAGLVTTKVSVCCLITACFAA